MPEIYRRDCITGVRLSVWQPNGSEVDYLSRFDSSWRLSSSNSAIRKQQERAAARCAALNLLEAAASYAQLVKKDSGQPALAGDSRYLSLTHCRGWGAAALAATPVGIDLEWIDENRSLEPARRFLNDQELPALEQSSRPQLLYFLFWSVKEGLYKVFNQQLNTISFRQHFRLEVCFDVTHETSGIVAAHVFHPQLKWKGHWFAMCIANFWLTWGLLG